MINVKKIFPLALSSIFIACEVPNDIPYPIVEGRITEFEVEGQCDEEGTGVGSAQIDKATRTIQLYVCDTVDLAQLQVKRIEAKPETKNPDVNYTNEVSIIPDSIACEQFGAFPRLSFNTPPYNSNTRMNFTKPVRFTLRTFQDYYWTVSVKQVIQRELEVENQVGNAIIDHVSKLAIVYVKTSQSLKTIKVKKFTLGGKHGKVSPDPTASDTYNFYDIQSFHITTGWGAHEEWKVMVYHTDATIETTAQVFARTVDASVSGNMPNGEVPEISYKAEDENTWTNLSPSAIQTPTSTTYEAQLSSLKPGTVYTCRVKAGTSQEKECTFTTTKLQQMPNSSFDQWSTDDKNTKLLYPWGDGEEPYWETGNKGATTVGNSNSVWSDNSSTGSGLSAHLESKYIVIKFAAGNIFTGSYLKTDGTNGILGFGRLFTAYPSQLRFDYKYKTAPINRVGDESLRYLQGRPDSCQLYVALLHVDANEYEEYNGDKFPFIIKTRPSEQRLFSPNDKRVIAYAQMTEGNDVNQWTSCTLDLVYKKPAQVPTHILVVASSSKYGDFFTGGEGACLDLDNLELLYN